MKELSLKEIQEGSFVVLLKIKEICDKNDWKYFLFHGSLLGAIRHNGFIPWDDDIDIGMPREDYEKFVEYCLTNKELIKPFELFYYKTNKKYPFPIARLSDSRYLIKNKYNINYGIGLFVDVYPFDSFNPDDRVFTKKQDKLYGKIVCKVWTRLLPPHTTLWKGIAKAPYYYKTKFFFPKLKTIIKNMETNSLAHSMQNRDSEYIECTVWSLKYWRFKKDWILNTKKHLFNGVEFNIPSNYDEVLKELYGDYMTLPPADKREGHHFYKAYAKTN